MPQRRKRGQVGRRMCLVGSAVSFPRLSVALSLSFFFPPGGRPDELL